MEKKNIISTYSKYFEFFKNNKELNEFLEKYYKIDPKINSFNKFFIKFKDLFLDYFYSYNLCKNEKNLNISNCKQEVKGKKLKFNLIYKKYPFLSWGLYCSHGKKYFENLSYLKYLYDYNLHNVSVKNFILKFNMFENKLFLKDKFLNIKIILQVFYKIIFEKEKKLGFYIYGSTFETKKFLSIFLTSILLKNKKKTSIILFSKLIQKIFYFVNDKTINLSSIFENLEKIDFLIIDGFSFLQLKNNWLINQIVDLLKFRFDNNKKTFFIAKENINFETKNVFLLKLIKYIKFFCYWDFNYIIEKYNVQKLIQETNNKFNFNNLNILNFFNKNKNTIIKKYLFLKKIFKDVFFNNKRNIFFLFKNLSNSEILFFYYFFLLEQKNSQIINLNNLVKKFNNKSFDENWNKNFSELNKAILNIDYLFLYVDESFKNLEVINYLNLIFKKNNKNIFWFFKNKINQYVEKNIFKEENLKQINKKIKLINFNFE